MDWTLVLVVISIMTLILLWIVFTKKVGRGFSDARDRWDPPRIVQDILTQEECKYIIEKATPLFSPSMIVGSSTPDNNIRTSETAWLDHGDPVVDKMIQKAMELTGKPLENCEKLQVVRYKPGTYYREHHDSCCDDHEGCYNFEEQGGQRVGTLLIYLNSEFTDGETNFPKFGDLKLKADPGSAIFFKPLSGECDKCHPHALHAGLPISSGIKYICNAWVRERKFNL
jgi:prolyl 4-hydroxylase